MTLYAINNKVHYFSDCVGYSLMDRICESEKYYLGKVVNPNGRASAGFYLYEKVPNKQFIDGYELILVTISDNCTMLKERVIRESKTYSIYQ